MRRPALLSLTAVVGLALTAGALAAAPASGTTPTPRVPVVSGWQRLSTVNVGTLSEPAVLRLPSGNLQVVWTQPDSSSVSSMRSRLIGSGGTAATLQHTVVANWSTLIDQPKLVMYGTKRLVAFAGIRSTSPSEKFYGPAAYATSADGLTWTLGSGSLSQTIYAYGSYGFGAVDNGGHPMIAVNASSSGFVTLHDGIDPSVPAKAADFTTDKLSCCAYSANLARDAKTGAVWTVWYSNSSTLSQQGIQAQRVWPRPNGTRMQGPGSLSAGIYVASISHSIGMAAPGTGGVWAAYPVGNPISKIRLWRVGTTTYRDLPVSGSVGQVGLTVGGAGRLWVFWRASSSGPVKAVRTNPTVTRFGAVRTLSLPLQSGTYTNVWNTAGNGALGPLDLLINAQIGSGASHIWYRRVYPGLQMRLSRTSVASSVGGSFTATVTDAGVPVPGAAVTFRGVKHTTSSLGTTSFSVPRGTPRGRYYVTATKGGYVLARLAFAVT